MLIVEIFIWVYFYQFQGLVKNQGIKALKIGKFDYICL